ncbi:TetR/AcrR family transcriptional regulator [Streptomyces sp. NPDC058739]|uniref:TetR/AcrR family transcriptional regulator n=1 Tax=Streptomyces sp. NPDC058739 TaxID=3346618 RepID=UPI003686FC20
MPTGTWERLPAERRKAVLDAAEAEFAERGFSGGSLNTICREAGVSKGSLFQYFEDKADMYVYLAELASRRVRAAMEAEIERLPWEKDFFAALDDMIGYWVTYFYDHPLELALTAAANLEPDPTARAPVRQAVNHHYLAVLSALLTKGAATGRLGPDADLDAVLSLLLLLLPHLALAPHVEGLDPIHGLYGANPERAAATAQKLLAVLLRPYRRDT